MPSLAIGCVQSSQGDEAKGGASIEPDCTREGAFAVELGEGEQGFESLEPGQQPMLYFGAQGGTHLILAGRVTTPDPLDRYEVSLLAEVCDAEDCASHAGVGSFTRVIEGDAIVVGEAEVEVPRLFLVVEGWAGAPAQRLTLEVVDACQRRASTQREFLP